jgi:SAM-dependent methyltransferase
VTVGAPADDQSYGWAAGRYAAAADPLVYRRLAVPLAEAVAGVAGDPHGPVLDVAAGTGALGRALGALRPGRQVVAVDLAYPALRYNPALRCVQADAGALPFPDGAFAVAASAFGINHVAAPAASVRELARVAPVVALSTWLRPSEPFLPRQAMDVALTAQVGTDRSPAGREVDRLSDAVGTPAALDELLAGAGLDARCQVVEVAVPWPGPEAFVAYRLAMPSCARPTDAAALVAAVRRAVDGIDPAHLTWRPRVIVAVGRRVVTATSPEPCRQRAAADEPVP